MKPLSPREALTMEALIEGRSIVDVAKQCGVTRETAKTYVTRATKKIGASSTLQAAVFYDRAKRGTTS